MSRLIPLYLMSLPLAFLACVFALGFALISQFGFDLHPCVLCIYQRWPYVGVMVIAGLGFFLARKTGRHYFELLCSLSFAATAAIGGFHVGVEQDWWKGLDGCVADTTPTSSLADLKAQIMAAPVVKCDEIAWQMFGISMAGYNLIFAGLMAIFMFMAFWYNKP